MTIIFNGRAFASKIEKNLEVERPPVLAAILIGENKASVIYLELKKKAIERVGGQIEIHKFPEQIGQSEVVQKIQQLNNNRRVHGIMIQLPVPTNLNLGALFEAIDRTKDVDGHRIDSPYLPATLVAILKIMEVAGVEEGASVVVVGEDGKVGSRLVRVLRDKKYSVMGVDINTQNPLEVTRMADVLITATGKPGLITEEWVKKGAVIIDIGAPAAEVQFTRIAPKVSFITPVPGGVGPVTVASLLENLVRAASLAG